MYNVSNLDACLLASFRTEGYACEGMEHVSRDASWEYYTLYTWREGVHGDCDGDSKIPNMQCTIYDKEL